MASRRAIEARNERTLRQILKEDGNRHCVDCGGFVRELDYSYDYCYYIETNTLVLYIIGSSVCRMQI